MTARDIVREVREHGGYFTIGRDGRLRLRNTKRVPPELLDQIRAHKAEIKIELESKRGAAR